MKYRSASGKCPCCLTKAVLMNAMTNCDDVLFQEDDGAILVAHFGTIRIRSHIEGRISVHSYGQEVMRMTPNDLEVIRPSRWEKTLEAIKADLEGRFGRVDAKHRH